MKTRVLFFLILFTLYLNVKNANANSLTWVGGTNTAWSNKLNWSPSTAAPTSADDVTIPTTTNHPKVDATAACKTLTISGTTILTLAANLNVSGTITVNSSVDFTIGAGTGFTITATGALTTNISSTMSIGANNTIKCTTLTTGQSASFTNSGTITASGAIITNISSTFLNNSTGSITTTSTVSIGQSTSFTNNGAITSGSDFSFGITVSPCKNTGSITENAGTFTIGQSVQMTSSGPIKITGILNIVTTSSITNSSTISVSGATTIGQASFIKSTAGTITLSSTLTIVTTGYITNAGIVSVTGKISIGQASYIVNTGTFTTLADIDIVTTGYISNSGTFDSSACTLSLGQASYVKNLVGGTYSLYGNSSVTFVTTAYIDNAGIFYAGKSNSPCIFTINTQSSYITNSASTGQFMLGSTSAINLTGITAYVSNTNSGAFTLMSDQYGSATLGAIGSNSTGFTGTYNVQRYLSGGNSKYRGYRLVSSPVNLTSTSGGGNIGLAYMNTNQTAPTTTTYNGALTGGTSGVTNGFTVANSNPALYLYIEALPSSNASYVSGKYAGITKVSSSTVDVLYSSTTSHTAVNIPVGTGYLFYFIGNNASTVTNGTRVPEATTMTATGYINQQNIPVKLWWNGSTTLSYTSTYGTNAGYNLVGNPYPSVIDLNQVYADNSSISGYTTFYELNDINPGQAYVSYEADNGHLSSPTYSSRYIASGQGFFVKATASSPAQTITFKEDQKVYNTSLLNSSSTTPILLSKRITPGQVTDKLVNSSSVKTNNIINPQDNSGGLHLMLQRDTATYRECGIYFNNDFSDKYDNHDAFDLDGIGLSVFMSSFTADGIRTGINSLSGYSKGKRIRLFVKAATSGLYHLNLEDINNVDTALFNIYLVDNFKKDSLDIARYKSYAFDIATTDTNSFGAGRFVLAIERKPLPPYDLIAFTGQKVKAGVQLNWKTYNEGNYTGFVLQKQTHGSFNPIDSLQSYNASDYSYTDNNPLTGNNVYRLKQSDINGLVTYSAPITITYNNASASGVFSVYPNPSRQMITINVNAVTGKAPAYVSNIYNTAGELMGQRAVNGSTWTQDVTSYKAGIYVIELTGNDGTLIGKTKFVKTN